MNIFKAIILIIGLTAVCCKNQTSKKTITKDENYLITENGVLGLSIGESMPEQLENYKLTKSVKIVEEGNEEPIIIIAKNNKEFLQISFRYDQEKGHFTNSIGEILIKDKRFKTEKNIGVGSTISDFISSYSNYNIWYTYLSGNYVIQSKDMKIQFFLDDQGYIGKQDLMESDMIELKKEDFSINTSIVEVRIY